MLALRSAELICDWSEFWRGPYSGIYTPELVLPTIVVRHRHHHRMARKIPLENVRGHTGCTRARGCHVVCDASERERGEKRDEHTTSSGSYQPEERIVGSSRAEAFPQPNKRRRPAGPGWLGLQEWIERKDVTRGKGIFRSDTPAPSPTWCPREAHGDHCEATTGGKSGRTAEHTPRRATSTRTFSRVLLLFLLLLLLHLTLSPPVRLLLTLLPLVQTPSILYRGQQSTSFPLPPGHPAASYLSFACG